jgi:hypothetical protein
MEVFMDASARNVSRPLKSEAIASVRRRIAGAVALMTVKVRASMFWAATVAAVAASPAVTFAGAQAQSIQGHDKALHDPVESSLIEIEYCVKKERHQDARSRGWRIPDPSIKKSGGDGIVCPIETNT